MLLKQSNFQLLYLIRPEAIRRLAHEFLTNPAKVTVGSDDLSANKRITQVVEVIRDVEKYDKLLEVLEKYSNQDTKNRMIVFVMRKSDARRMEKYLWEQGFSVASIHGNKSQPQREQALRDFKAGTINILVATGEIHIYV